MVLSDAEAVVLGLDYTAAVDLVVSVEAVAAVEIAQGIATQGDYRFDVAEVAQLIQVDQVVVVVAVVAAAIEVVVVDSSYRAEVDHWTLAEEVQHCCLVVLLVGIDSAEGIAVAEIAD